MCWRKDRVKNASVLCRFVDVRSLFLIRSSARLSDSRSSWVRSRYARFTVKRIVFILIFLISRKNGTENEIVFVSYADARLIFLLRLSTRLIDPRSRECGDGARSRIYRAKIVPVSISSVLKSRSRVFFMCFRVFAGVCGQLSSCIELGGSRSL